MTSEHDRWKVVLSSMSGNEIKETLSDEFNDFKRTEATSVLSFAAAK